MNDRQRLEAILSVVCKYLPPDGISKDQAINEIISLVDPLPKQEQGEPVAITITGKLGNIYSFTGDYSLKKGDKVYTTPQQRKPLTDEDFLDWYDSAIWGNEDFKQGCWRAFEAGWQLAHGIKE